MTKFHYPLSNNDIVNDIEILARKYGTDKRVEDHGYTFYYDLFFRDMRCQHLTLLEIGVYQGASVRMWHDYFPYATIVGLDINPACKDVEGGRIKVFIGSQDDPVFIDELCNEYPKGFDIVIDDGSHMMSHQIKSLELLFKRVSSGGFYVIEDLSCCYEVHAGTQYRNMGNKTTMSILAELADKINMNGMSKANINTAMVEIDGKSDDWMEHLCFMFLAKEICFLGRR